MFTEKRHSKGTGFTKIVCTIGPASCSRKRIKALIQAGMDVARINLSHGNHKSHASIIEGVRLISKELRMPTALLADLQGPKIRIGEVTDGAVLTKGEPFVITTRNLIGNSAIVTIDYPQLTEDIRTGNQVLIDDGLLLLEVISKSPGQVTCTVLRGGPLRSHKGVNLPDVAISAPSLTPKDHKDLRFVLGKGVDYVALSFVRKAEDLSYLRRVMCKSGDPLPIIAKIERPEAIRDIDSIIEEADGIMVARGDLGVEMSSEEVPLLQKMIIRRSIDNKKPVITATQMLESMVYNSRPTRAESSDVANAVLDGTSAVMLSAETSVGGYPVESVQAMRRIIGAVEAKRIRSLPEQDRVIQEGDLTDAVAQAACRMADLLKAKAIVALTHSGHTALLISSYRPQRIILGITDSPKVQRLMNLYWGVRGILAPEISDTDTTLDNIESILKMQDCIEPGDYIIHTTGMPLLKRGTTNMLKVSVVQ